LDASVDPDGSRRIQKDRLDTARGLQQELAEIAKSLGGGQPRSGQWGLRPGTEASVQSFQRFTGLPIDGVVGDHTWYAPVGGVGRLLGFAGLGDD
jgi:peptidoglycan hydrolase-like protein with peptidoglycan-binding domain